MAAAEPHGRGGGRGRPVVHISGDAFYAPASATVGLPVAFAFGRDGEVSHVMIRGEPYHPVDIVPAFVPDASLLGSYVGLHRDPSNANDEEMVSVRVEDGVLVVAEGIDEAPTRAIGERCFLGQCGMGLFEFEFEDAAPVHRSRLVEAKDADTRGG